MRLFALVFGVALLAGSSVLPQSKAPAEKKDDIYDGDAISAPVAYRDLMLVVVSAKGASALTFKEEEDDDESVSYQFRYESRDRKERYEGRGKVAGGIQTIKAGGVTLLWSRAKRGHGWIYYNPDKTAVHLAHEQDYADRVTGLFGDRTQIPKLDLRRFMK
jgi:hypothetical protein